MPGAVPTLVEHIDAALPQTQCRRCGQADCHAYAEAIATGGAPIDRCPPGGAEGIVRLAALTGQRAVPLDPAVGVQGPLRLAQIDEAWCIGCTLCLQACPVDCIVGAPKLMHTVVAAQCTGCELCLPACPVDCISMVVAPTTADPPPTGWAAWSAQRAAESRERYAFHRLRFGSAATALGETEPAGGSEPGASAPSTGKLPALATPDGPGAVHRRALIDAAMARARARRSVAG